MDRCRREWLRPTLRSTRSWATGFDVIDVPRSACTARGMPCTAMACLSMFLAMRLSSRAATVQAA